MFKDQRAWFCRSVGQDLQELWEAQGGVICSAREADFLFSCDASHPDTRRYPCAPAARHVVPCSLPSCNLTLPRLVPGGPLGLAEPRRPKATRCTENAVGDHFIDIRLLNIFCSPQSPLRVWRSTCRSSCPQGAYKEVRGVGTPRMPKQSCLQRFRCQAHLAVKWQFMVMSFVLGEVLWGTCNLMGMNLRIVWKRGRKGIIRIYESFDYMEDNATVFHAYYLSAVANVDMKNTVPLGHYVLPPACLQKEIRKKIGSFIWEQNNVMTEKHDEVKPSEMQKQLRENTELLTQPEKDPFISTKKHFSRTPVTGKQLYYPLQNYPVNNMVTGYVSVDTMKKFLGELHDFIPGSSGYLAYHVQKEINVFSAVKNKLKRKC
ncbi:telomere repeats-binding bouquet formation protein 2 isoform X1 [Notamacropus eugenii]|uniref:telomere repeats-binding bouquet formation protein 2 isoform X1 n=1 Tax=Notamacropus eugenii TaxID=9315 RepID=UPI003B67C28F